MPTEFKLDDCLGLSKKEVHRTQDQEGICKHVANSNGFQYACHPVIIENEPFALLHYYYQSAQISSYQLKLARIAADTVKLALANLRMKERLREDSIRDSLTGLFNRRYMIETLNLEIAQADRSGKPLAAIMIDIDHYKNINDRFGHAVGDHVLVGVGRVLQENIRRGDIACRFGGDEFVLVMPGMSLDVGIARAESIREKISDLDFAFGHDNSVRISLSLGVATFPQQAGDVESLLKAADNALYTAKEKGRNQTVAAT
jgi:diguanylate cyclase (GGDEF)-like protein